MCVVQTYVRQISIQAKRFRLPNTTKSNPFPSKIQREYPALHRRNTAIKHPNPTNPTNTQVKRLERLPTRTPRRFGNPEKQLRALRSPMNAIAVESPVAHIRGRLRCAHPWEARRRFSRLHRPWPPWEAPLRTSWICGKMTVCHGTADIGRLAQRERRCLTSTRSGVQIPHRPP